MFARCDFIRNAGNIGKLASLNIALAQVDTKFSFILDSDDFIHPDYMRHIVEYAGSAPHVDFFYPEKITLVDEFDNPMNAEWKYPDFADSTAVVELLFKLGKSPIRYYSAIANSHVIHTHSTKIP